jgi:putative transposase
MTAIPRTQPTQCCVPSSGHDITTLMHDRGGGGVALHLTTPPDMRARIRRFVKRNLMMDLSERAGQSGSSFVTGRAKFTVAFDDVFAGNGTRVIKAPVRSPRANSFAERFVGTLRRECMDHVLILGEQHLRKVLAEYARHYNGHRPHQGRHQEPPLRQPGHTVDITAGIERRSVVGGLISEYCRAA